MSKICPFCDDVKDSELNSAEKFKEHLHDEHENEIVGKGEPKRITRNRNGLTVEKK